MNGSLPFDLGLVLGQSNARGKGTPDNLDASLFTLPYTRSIYGYAQVKSPGTILDRWNRIIPVIGASTNAWGVEVPIGMRFAGSYPGRKLALLKTATGSVNLDVDWDKGNTSGEEMYDGMLAYASTRLPELGTVNTDYVTRFVVWVQGEDDSLDSGMASRYQTNLVSLASNLRSDFGNNSLVMVIVKLHDDYTGEFAPEIRTAQQGFVAGDSNAILVDGSSLVLGGGVEDPPVHYYDNDTGKSITGLGGMCFDAMVNGGVFD